MSQLIDTRIRVVFVVHGAMGPHAPTSYGYSVREDLYWHQEPMYTARDFCSGGLAAPKLPKAFAAVAWPPQNFPSLWIGGLVASRGHVNFPVCF